MADIDVSNPSGSGATPPEPRTFQVVDFGDANKFWQLSLHPGHLALHESPTAQPYILLRTGYPKEFNFSERLHALTVYKPFKVTLRLSPEATEAVSQWFGESFLAANVLRRRYGFILPWAIVWLIGAMPLPNTPMQAGKAFSGLDFALALTLIGAWALARWRPHFILFLVDCLWFSYLTAYLSWEIISGERSRWWVLMVMLVGGMALTGLQHFLRYRGVKIAPLKR